MAPAFDTFPAADAWPVPDPRRAVPQLSTGATSANGITGTTGTTRTHAPPRTRGTAGPLLPSTSRVRPTVRS